jgi:hypothetical protein
MPKMQLPNPTIIRHDKPALPRDWSTLPGAEGLVFQGDVAVSKRSSLRAKVLLFRDHESMRRFWSKALGRPALSHDTLAVSNPLTVKVHFCKVKGKPQRPPELRVDPRYFCALGFAQGALTPEFIIHESVHAGFAYSRRVGGKHDWVDDCEEERVCYPAGRIADGIIRMFSKGGFFGG